MIYLNPSSLEEVYAELCSLNLKKSTGPDDIPSYFVKLAAPILAPYLTYFIEMSFKLGVFSNSLKAARVVAVFKKGCKSTIENYRPISILPALSKVFEKVLSTKLLSFFNQNSVLQCAQYGFCKKHNTTHAVVDDVSHIYENIFSNNFSCFLTLDLKKAFDTNLNTMESEVFVITFFETI